MKKTISYLVVALLGIASLMAQEDPDSKAQQYLAMLKEKAKSSNTLEIEFESRIVNTTEQINISQNGNIKIKGDKFYLKLDDTDLIVDGDAMYTISDCEVYINDMPEDDDLGLNPSNFFTIDNSYFKYKIVKEISLDGKDVAIIELYPKAPKEAQFISITLTIDKKKMEPYIIEVKGREGNVYTYKVKKFVVNQSFSDNLFKFVISAFPCVEEVTDLRDN